MADGFTDQFFEEDGNRLNSRGSGLFNSAAHAISFLGKTDVAGTDEIILSVLLELERLVLNEIDYALANGGDSRLIACAIDLVDLARTRFDSNPSSAATTFRLAWVRAFAAVD